MKTRVAVVYGGRSGEHEVSIRSARSIMDALDKERFEVIPLFIRKDGRWDPKPIVPEPGANDGIDVVIPVLHGTFGEDGTIQGLFEMAALPYVGAGVFSSAASMDKWHMKRLFADRGLPVVECEVLEGISGVENWKDFPVFVKPANLGSSVGISKAKNLEELNRALALASKYDHRVLVERAIVGMELECAVLGNDHPRASTPCEIVPSREFYDYEDKYLLDAAQFHLPARIAPEKIEEVKQLAVAAFQAVDCSGLARVDFLLEAATGKLFLNEINTFPGFTSISMYPKMWAHDGIGFAQLVERLIELALERHRLRQALRYEL